RTARLRVGRRRGHPVAHLLELRHLGRPGRLVMRRKRTSAKHKSRAECGDANGVRLPRDHDFATRSVLGLATRTAAPSVRESGGLNTTSSFSLSPWTTSTSEP